MTSHDAEPDEAQTPLDTHEGTETPEEAQRRKFREALEKKKLGHHGQGMAAQGGVQSAHSGPAVQKRVHRRKGG